MRFSLLVGLILALYVNPAVAAVATRTVDYGRDIRPILAENCFHCHGQDEAKRKAKIRLDTLDGQRAESLVVPGRPQDSEVIKRIFTSDTDDVMPPPDSNRRLSKEQKELLRRWVVDGAPFDGHWAFATPQRPHIPAVKNQTWIRNPIDAFVLQKLENYKLFPSPEADKETLIRRVTLDLTGLPPQPEEVDDFLADKRPDAYERLVDRLLSSPHYGERMALPWLDAARYADSNGFQWDGDTFQWVWRDWVVKAFNDNIPFDEFTIEQLAGDLLPDASHDQKLATAFVRNGLLNGEGGNIPEEQRFVLLFDRVDTAATNWLGLTMACAQCHDHKYDPITQRDYYAMLASFNNVPETGIAEKIGKKIGASEPLLDCSTPEQRATLKRLEQEVATVKEQLQQEQTTWESRVRAGKEQVDDKQVSKFLSAGADNKATKELSKDQRKKVNEYFSKKVAPKLAGKLNEKLKQSQEQVREFRQNEMPKVMIMSDAKPRETFVLDRGNYETPLEKVGVDVPAFLPPLPPDAPRNRLGIARWLVSKEQPLTPRVIVNRMWQMFFGIGFVKTAEDFGVQSEVPLHGHLLDWLAVEFRDSGWDMKHLHRLIVTSATYRQTSAIPPSLMEIDPENRLYARASRFRLPSLFIRDQALAASGLLVRTIGGKPVYPYQPKGIWDSLQITEARDFTYTQSTGLDLYRRSLYTFWRRTVAPANMFDVSQRQNCKVRTAITSTPLHALTTLNDPTFVEAARVLAERVMSAPADERLAQAWRRVLCRWPDAEERSVLSRSLDKQKARFAADPAAAKAFLAVGESHYDEKIDAVELASYAAVCLGILNLDETLTRQ